MSMTSAEAQISREQLRTFHIAGRGLEHLAPAVPLDPVVLDEPSPAPSVAFDGLRALHAAALAESRANTRKLFLDKIDQAHEQLRSILGPDGRQSPASLGSEADTFFNTSALAEALQEPPNRVRSIEPGRRARIEATLATLEDALLEFAG